MTDDFPSGTPVEVRDDSGRTLFYGKVASTGCPWVFWHRVTPDGDIDLPPRFTVVKREVT
jgi:hypothetical protein